MYNVKRNRNFMSCSVNKAGQMFVFERGSAPGNH